MLYLQAYKIDIQRIKPFVRAAAMVAATYLIYLATAWVIANIDELLSFRAFKWYFLAQTIMWIGVGVIIVRQSRQKRRLARQPISIEP